MTIRLHSAIQVIAYNDSAASRFQLIASRDVVADVEARATRTVKCQFPHPHKPLAILADSDSKPEVMRGQRSNLIDEANGPIPMQASACLPRHPAVAYLFSLDPWNLPITSPSDRADIVASHRPSYVDISPARRRVGLTPCRGWPIVVVAAASRSGLWPSARRNGSFILGGLSMIASLFLLSPYLRIFETHWKRDDTYASFIHVNRCNQSLAGAMTILNL